LGLKKERELASNVSKPKDKIQPKRAGKPASASGSKKKQNRIARWWRSTLGELRKVSWPTPQEAWRLTKVVLLVVLVMAAVLGLLDYVFSRGIAALVSL
jgi:preprotein translocase subunit SecE